MSRVLLINFEPSEQERLRDRFQNLPLDSGFLGGEYRTGSGPPCTFFWFPLSVYEYDVAFLKLKGRKRGEDLEPKQIEYGSAEVQDLCRFWSEGKGVVVVFIEEACFDSLWFLGLDILKLQPARGRDRTVVSHTSSHPLESMLHQKRALVRMPAPCYLELPSLHTFPQTLYENLNNQILGLCYYKRLSVEFPPPSPVLPSSGSEEHREPYLLVLPPFKEYVEVTHEILKCVASTRKTLLPEIREADWRNSDAYYPPSVAEIEDEIAKTITYYDERLRKLRQRKQATKENWAFLREILLETGDGLKSSVIRVFREIWQLQVTDLDESKQGGRLREDLLISDGNKTLFAEVKGTRNKNPTFAWVAQVLTHEQLRDRPETIPCLILNLDLHCEPSKRPQAYTEPDEAQQLEKLVFLDTRILFDLSVALVSKRMTVPDAHALLFRRGRVGG